MSYESSVQYPYRDACKTGQQWVMGNLTMIEQIVSNPAYPNTGEQHRLVWPAAASIPHQRLASTANNYNCETRTSLGSLCHCGRNVKTTMHKRDKHKNAQKQA